MSVRKKQILARAIRKKKLGVTTHFFSLNLEKCHTFFVFQSFFRIMVAHYFTSEECLSTLLVSKFTILIKKRTKKELRERENNVTHARRNPKKLVW